MKIFILLAVVVSFAACSQDNSFKNESKKQNEEACTSLEKFAEKVMKQHQSNILISAVFKEVDSMPSVPEESKEMLKNIAIDAYKQPVFTDQSIRDRQVVDFATDTHLKCLEIMK